MARADRSTQTSKLKRSGKSLIPSRSKGSKTARSTLNKGLTTRSRKSSPKSTTRVTPSRSKRSSTLTAKGQPKRPASRKAAPKRSASRISSRKTTPRRTTSVKKTPTLHRKKSMVSRGGIGNLLRKITGGSVSKVTPKNKTLTTNRRTSTRKATTRPSRSYSAPSRRLKSSFKRSATNSR